MLARVTLLVDKDSRSVKIPPPVVYPGCASGTPELKENNCQPILWGPGDPAYYEVFDIIDRASARKGVMAGEYIRGVP